MATLNINNLEKRFKQTEVLKGINLNVEEGDFLVLLGPSGCGKSTTGRTMLRLTPHTEGAVYYKDNNIRNIIIDSKNRPENNIAYFDGYSNSVDVNSDGVYVIDFENASLEKMGMIPEIVVRYRSPYFAHIFAGGYSAGYYSYAWAEVLDADAFEAFKEKGIFNKEVATKFKEHVLSKGGTEKPMVLYKRFRGQEPKPEALLKRAGLL